MRPLDALIRPLIAAAQAAGEAILRIYEAGDFSVATKDDASPVTSADLASQQVIVERLQALAPEIPILSEEQEQVSYAERRGWQRLFVVDPLDGTREFLGRNGEFTVNIALVEQGLPRLGVVFAPVLRRTYWGVLESGAFRIDGEGERAIRVGADSGNLRVIVSRSHQGASLRRFLAAIPDHRPLEIGSSLKFCRLAEGAADFYPRLTATMEWDTAAGDAVLRAAGGRVFDLENGEPLRYNRENLRNPYFVALGAREVSWQDAWKSCRALEFDRFAGVEKAKGCASVE